MCYGYLVELPQWGDSNEYPQQLLMFLWRGDSNEDSNEYPQQLLMFLWQGDSNEYPQHMS